ncbi:MAG: hypothetical protein ABI740_01025, partial [Alphaproteobacteria bacterium]
TSSFSTELAIFRHSRPCPDRPDCEQNQSVGAGLGVGAGASIGAMFKGRIVDHPWNHRGRWRDLSAGGSVSDRRVGG